MARRRPSAFEDLLTLASKLPWKISLALAVASFIALHLVAGAFSQQIPAASTADLGGVVIRQYIRTFAMILQYIIPAALVVGGMVSLVTRSRSISLIDDVRRGNGRDVSSLSWQEFETLVGEGFRQRGFQVTERGGAGADGGVDLTLNRGNEKSLVQCKQWRAQQVGVSIVRELYGVMAAEGAEGGYVVTSGKFTNDAVEFSKGRNIELIDGAQLRGLLREGPKPAPQSTVKPITPRASQAPPTCPSCQCSMVERIAKRGTNAGQSFWGCRLYPKCRYTLPKTT